MKKLFLVLFFTSGCLVANSQEKPDKMHTAYVRFQAKFGFVNIDKDKMNNALGSMGFAPFDNFNHPEFSMLIKRPHRRWGATIAYTHFNASNNAKFLVDPVTNTFTNRTLKGAGIKISNEYYLLDRAFLKLYIPLSLHWTKLSMHTFENIPLNFGLQNASDVNKNRFTSRKEAAEISLNFETGIPISDLIISVGVNAGYRLDYDHHGWKYEDQIGLIFPSFHNQGFVFGISIGLNSVRYRPRKPQM